MTTNSETPPAPVRQPARILVVEDSPLNQQVALKQLEKLGYEAEAVTDGAMAVDAQSRSPYDVILMDCQMPGMNGYDATQLIRVREGERTKAGEPVKRAYVIAMTANTETDIRERCTEAGMDDFINKPVLLVELDAVLRRAFFGRNAAQNADDVIDPVVIAGLRQLRAPGRPDPLVEFIDLFLREAPVELDALADAASHNDADSLSRALSAASALKGSSANLGARHLAALCEEVEQIARNWVLSDAIPIIQRARQEFDHVRETLEKLKQN
jgi:CheY-like chemotaxis protein